MPADHAPTGLTIERPDDEHIEIYLGNRLVASASHDDHGWTGMDAVERTALAVDRAARQQAEQECGQARRDLDYARAAGDVYRRQYLQARADVDLYRPVIDAASTWRATWTPIGDIPTGKDVALINAVDDFTTAALNRVVVDRDPDCGCTPPCGHGTYAAAPVPAARAQGAAPPAVDPAQPPANPPEGTRQGPADVDAPRAAEPDDTDTDADMSTDMDARIPRVHADMSVSAPGPQDIPDEWLAALVRAADHEHYAGIPLLDVLSTAITAGYRTGFAAHAGCEITVSAEDDLVLIGDRPEPADAIRCAHGASDCCADRADPPPLTMQALDQARHDYAQADTDEERAEVLGDLLADWYAAWPSTADTDPHQPIAQEILRIVGTGPAATAATRAQALDAATRLMAGAELDRPDAPVRDLEQITVAMADRWADWIATGDYDWTAAGSEPGPRDTEEPAADAAAAAEKQPMPRDTAESIARVIRTHYTP